LQFRVAGGDWFDARRDEVLEHRLELELRHGVLVRHLVWQDGQGRRTRMEQRRFVSMADQHLAALRTTFTAENWSGAPEVRSGLDGRVVNAGVRRYRDLNGRHLTVVDQAEVGDNTVDLQAETSQSHVRIALAARTTLGDPDCGTGRRRAAEPGFIAHELGIELREGRPATVDKVDRPLYLQGLGDLGVPCGRAAGAGGCRRLRAAARPPRARVGQPVEQVGLAGPATVEPGGAPPVPLKWR
jgi:trehalose/maltose hydrolase-like predicted phosphorylase